jgi:hypothetical protein
MPIEYFSRVDDLLKKFTRLLVRIDALIEKIMPKKEEVTLGLIAMILALAFMAVCWWIK